MRQMFFLLIFSSVSYADLCSHEFQDVAFRNAWDFLMHKERPDFFSLGVRHPETLGQHSLRLEHLTRIFFSRLEVQAFVHPRGEKLKKVDREFLEESALMSKYHHIGESTRNGKTEHENLLALLRRGSQEKEILYDLLIEFKYGISPRRDVLNDLDVILTFVEAMRWIAKGEDADALSVFFQKTQKAIQNDFMKPLFSKLLQEFQDGILKDPYARYEELLREFPIQDFID